MVENHTKKAMQPNTNRFAQKTLCLDTAWHKAIKKMVKIIVENRTKKAISSLTKTILP